MHLTLLMERLKKSSFAFVSAAWKVGILHIYVVSFISRFCNILIFFFFVPLDAQAFKKAFEDAQKGVLSNAEGVEELLQGLKVDDKEEKKCGKEDKENAIAANDKEASSTVEGK